MIDDSALGCHNNAAPLALQPKVKTHAQLAARATVAT
jgi:hypothetical protein